jgi:hypothetical protein
MQVVATKPSLAFFSAAEIRETGTNVWVDEDEWDVRTSRHSIPDIMTIPRAAELQDW